MSRQYNEEYKREAVHQVLEKGRAVTQVAHDLGLSTKTLNGYPVLWDKLKEHC